MFYVKRPCLPHAVLRTPGEETNPAMVLEPEGGEMGAIESEAQLRPEQVMLLRLFKRGGLVLLLLAWLDRPVGETEVAAVLEVDRITARSYLRSLLAMGLISRTRREQGYRLTPGGQGILFSQMVRISPSQPSSAAASGLTLLVNSNTEAEKETPNEGENLTIQDALTHQGQENLAAFRAQGIGANDRVKRACSLEHVSPKFIQVQADRLRRQGRFSTGLLLLVVENNDPLPSAPIDPDDEAGRQRYVSGRFAEFIEH